MSRGTTVLFLRTKNTGPPLALDRQRRPFIPENQNQCAHSAVQTGKRTQSFSKTPLRLHLRCCFRGAHPKKALAMQLLPPARQMHAGFSKPGATSPLSSVTHHLQAGLVAAMEYMGYSQQKKSLGEHQSSEAQAVAARGPPPTHPLFGTEKTWDFSGIRPLRLVPLRFPTLAPIPPTPPPPILCYTTHSSGVEGTKVFAKIKTTDAKSGILRITDSVLSYSIRGDSFFFQRGQMTKGITHTRSRQGWEPGSVSVQCPPPPLGGGYAGTFHFGF